VPFACVQSGIEWKYALAVFPSTFHTARFAGRTRDHDGLCGIVIRLCCRVRGGANYSHARSKFTLDRKPPCSRRHSACPQTRRG
jgi:hypothetical protein